MTSTTNIGVSAIFSLVGVEGAGTAGAAAELITEAGVGTSKTTTEFAIAVDTIGVFNTGVAVQNLSTSKTDLSFSLFDAQGKPQKTVALRSLSGNGHLALFVAGPGGLFPSLGDFRGKMVVGASNQGAALTLRQRVDTGNPLTTLPVVSTDSAQTTFTLPQVANGTGIRTTFVMFNLSTSQSANVEATLTQDEGTALNVKLSDGQSGGRFSFVIPPCGTLFVETDALGEVTAGAARVVSDVPISVSAIFSLLTPQGEILTEAGVGDSPQLSRFSLPVDLTMGFNTGMALFNNHSAAATIQARFFTQEGNRAPPEVEFKVDPFSLASANHLARFVSELIVNLSDTRGQLDVVSDLSLAALTLRQGGSTLTTLPVNSGVANVTEPPLIESPADGLCSNDATPTLRGTAEPGSTVRLKEGGSLLAEASADESGNWSIPSPALSEDIHGIIATAEAPGMFESQASSAVNISVDLTAPTILNLQPLETLNLRPTISADWSDGGGCGIDESTATISLDGMNATPEAVLTPDGLSFVADSVLGDGFHTVTVMVRDLAGNSSLPFSSTFRAFSQPGGADGLPSAAGELFRTETNAVFGLPAPSLQEAIRGTTPRGGGGGTVVLNNGEHAYAVEDLMIPGCLLHWRHIRYYHSQIGYDGPQGQNWDFNYNIRLGLLPSGDVIFFNGTGRRDRYVFDAPNNRYLSPDGFYDTLSSSGPVSNPIRYEILTRHGTHFSFAIVNDDRHHDYLLFPETGEQFVQVYHVTRIQDRNHNRLAFAYNDHPVEGFDPSDANRNPSNWVRLTMALDTYDRGNRLPLSA